MHLPRFFGRFQIRFEMFTAVNVKGWLTLQQVTNIGNTSKRYVICYLPSALGAGLRYIPVVFSLPFRHVPLSQTKRLIIPPCPENIDNIHLLSV
jgi:hypothetical protein